MMAPSMIAAGAAGSKHPVGTGPFVFSGWEENSSLTVNRNPHYWGGLDAAGKVQQGTPYLDSIRFRVITDDQTRSEALQSGDIDMLSTISARTANSLAGSFNEVKDWDAGSVFVQPNTVATVNGKPNPMANIHARLALAYATDAKAIAALAGKGLNLATSPFGPNTPWGMPSSQNGYVNYNLTQAKSEVAEYEKETGDTSLTITLMGLPNIDVVTSLQALSAQWAKAGITTHIQTLDQSARITAVVTGNYEVDLHQQLRLPGSGQRVLLLGLVVDQAAAGHQHQLRPLRHAPDRQGPGYGPPERLRERSASRPTTIWSSSSTPASPTSGCTTRPSPTWPPRRCRAWTRRRARRTSRSGTSTPRPGGVRSRSRSSAGPEPRPGLRLRAPRTPR